jgi:hypothetical protein
MEAQTVQISQLRDFLFFILFFFYYFAQKYMISTIFCETNPPQPKEMTLELYSTRTVISFGGTTL